MTVVKSVELDISVSGDAESRAKLDAITLKADSLKKTFGPALALKIDAAAATAKLAVFRGQFKAVSDAVTRAQDVQVVTARAQKALDGVRVQADRLRATFPEMKAQIDTAEATRKLAVLAADAKITGDAIDRALTRGGGGRGAGGLLGALGGAGSAAPAAAAAAPLLANPYVAGGIGAGVIAAVASGAAGVIPLLAAATLGAGAFGALALPTFKSVFGAVSALSAATAAYDAATTKAARNTALTKIRQDWAALTPGQAAAVKGIQALQATYDKMAAAFAKPALAVLNGALKVANDLLPALTPLAAAAASALAPLLAHLDQFAKSRGFGDFIANMSKLAGPAITALGEGIGKVLVSLGKLLVAMESPNGLRILKGAFDVLSGTITGIAWAFTHLTPVVLKVFHDIAGAFDQGRHNAAAAVHQISDIIDTIRVTWVTVGHAMETAWNTSWNAMKTAFNTVKGAVLTGVKTLADGILTYFGTIINGAAAAFGWVPIIGGPLKAAAKAFNTFAAQVNAALASIISPTVTVTAVLVGPNLGGIRAHAAAGLYIRAGTGPTADDVLVRASRGELIVPAHLVAAGAVDHLRGRGIPGFAAGGIPHRWPAVPWLDAHQRHVLHEEHLHHLHAGHAEHLENRPGGGDPVLAELRALRRAVEHVADVAGAIPAKTGQHVGAAVNGAAGQAAFRARYP